MRKLLFIALLFCLPALGQVTVSPFVTPNVQFLSNSGTPLAGGKVCTFAAGSTTPQTSYSDSAGSVANANPVVLDSAGRASIWLTTQTYKIVVAASTANSQCSPAITSTDNVSWATMANTVTSLVDTGALTVQASAAATSGANQSSPLLCVQGNYWTGAASASDKWCLQDLLGTGSNPTTTLNVTHGAGSSGTAAISFPMLTVTGASTLSSGGTLTGTFAGNPTFSGNPVFSGAVSGSTTGTLQNFAIIDNVVYADDYKAASTTCGITEANAVVAAMGLGNSIVMLPFGLCTATATIPLQDGTFYKGYGGKSRTNSLNECGTLIKNATTDVFTYSGTKSGDFGLQDFCAWSGTGGGDVLKFTASTSRLKIHDFYLQQDNAAKGAIVSTTATNSFVGNKFYEGLIVYSVTPTVSIINVVSNSMNSVVFDNVWIQTSVAGAVTAATITINDTGVNACASEMVLRNIQIEPPGGANNYVGGIVASGMCGLLLDTVDVDATGYTPTGPAISITPVSTLPSGITAPITIMNSTSYTGTNAFPDLFVAKTTPSQVTLIGNNFLWIGGSAGNPFTYVDINNNIANQHDTTLALGITATGQIKSSLATGTAPLVIASTTPVANLSINGGGTVDGDVIGGVTPAAGTFTTLQAGTYERTGVSNSRVMVANDFTTANNANLQNITGLSWTFPATAGNYSFHCGLFYSQAGAAVSDTFGIQAVTNNPTQINIGADVVTSVGPPSNHTFGILTSLATTTATAFVTFTPGAITQVFYAYVDGSIELGASANTVNIMVQTSNGADAITVKRGSYCVLY